MNWRIDKKLMDDLMDRLFEMNGSCNGVKKIVVWRVVIVRIALVTSLRKVGAVQFPVFPATCLQRHKVASKTAKKGRNFTFQFWSLLSDAIAIQISSGGSFITLIVPNPGNATFSRKKSRLELFDNPDNWLSSNFCILVPFVFQIFPGTA